MKQYDRTAEELELDVKASQLAPLMNRKRRRAYRVFVRRGMRTTSAWQKAMGIY